MRKITRQSLDELAKAMPVLSEKEQKMFVGGGTSSSSGGDVVDIYLKYGSGYLWLGTFDSGVLIVTGYVGSFSGGWDSSGKWIYGGVSGASGDYMPGEKPYDPSTIDPSYGQSGAQAVANIGHVNNLPSSRLEQLVGAGGYMEFGLNQKTLYSNSGEWARCIGSILVDRSSISLKNASVALLTPELRACIDTNRNVDMQLRVYQGGQEVGRKYLVHNGGRVLENQKVELPRGDFRLKFFVSGRSPFAGDDGKIVSYEDELFSSAEAVR